MRSLLEVVPTTYANVCEAFKDSRLYHVYRELGRRGLKFKDVIYRRTQIQWDKIDSSDIEEYDKSDFKQIKALVMDRRKNPMHEKEFFIFGFRDEELTHMYDSAYTSIITFTTVSGVGRSDDDYLWDTHIQSPDYYNRANQRISTANQLAMLQLCDYYVVVHTRASGKGSADMQVQRKKAQDGALVMNAKDHKSIHREPSELGKSGGGLSLGGSYYNTCMYMARKNRERWKSVAAKRRADKDDRLSTMADTIDKLMPIMFKATRLIQTCEEMNRDIEQHILKLCDNISKCIDCYSKAAYAYSKMKTGSNYYSEEFTNYVNVTLNSIKLANEHIDKIKEALGDVL